LDFRRRWAGDSVEFVARKSIVICGPTATGKTAFAIELADRVGGEIISADSMQVYRGMDIGTAKPTVQEQQHTPFHLLDVVYPDRQFTAADWKRGAERAIADIRSRGRMPILCGGTGMYLRALLRNWSMADTPRDDEVRRSLESELAVAGSAGMHDRLKSLDAESAMRLHPNDALRILRALEVCIVSGSALSALHEKDKQISSNDVGNQTLQFALTLPREELYSRIDNRVDSMMLNGLEDEVQHLLSSGYSDELPAMNSLGYKEMCAYLRGDTTREAAIEQIKLNTRRYAKRQLTWFRSETEITWVDTSIICSAEIVNSIAAALTHCVGAELKQHVSIN
jgi:tRNA dimethylallyltransferase